jgi:hypothetical protein
MTDVQHRLQVVASVTLSVASWTRVALTFVMPAWAARLTRPALIALATGRAMPPSEKVVGTFTVMVPPLPSGCCVGVS